MTTNCCTSCGTDERASVDNCAAGARCAATSSAGAIEYLRTDLSTSILQKEQLYLTGDGLQTVRTHQKNHKLTHLLYARSSFSLPAWLLLCRPVERRSKPPFQYLGLRIEP